MGWFYAVLAAGVFGLLVYAGFRAAYRAGEEKQRAENETQKRDAALRAGHVRDRLRRDADFARRVRQRFTRR
ncbi:MAG: hypothetical protein EA357_10665 [Micavibrio sp.]|nr:MAG: hypothetical protein EA357_10665 [Micavibrio sp.]